VDLNKYKRMIKIMKGDIYYTNKTTFHVSVEYSDKFKDGIYHLDTKKSTAEIEISDSEMEKISKQECILISIEIPYLVDEYLINPNTKLFIMINKDKSVKFCNADINPNIFYNYHEKRISYTSDASKSLNIKNISLYLIPGAFDAKLKH
jgi:hypothetical protein